jgi:hypothetical protein
MRKFISAVTLIASVLGFSIAAAPAQAATAVPSITQININKPLPAGGQNITLFGKNFSVVSQVIIDKTTATIVSKTATTLTFISPPHAEGRVNVSLKYGTKTYVLRGGLLYKASLNRVLVPLPFIPETLRAGRTVSMQPGNSAWKVTVSTTSTRICSITGLEVKALRRGECALSIEIEVPTMDPTYRSRQALYFITVN